MTLFSQVATVRTASMPSTRCWTSTARLAALTCARALLGGATRTASQPCSLRREAARPARPLEGGAPAPGRAARAAGGGAELADDDELAAGEALHEAAGRHLGARRLGLFGAGGVDTPRLAPDRRQALDGRRHGLDAGRRPSAAPAGH